ncbi:unnamed protein product [Lactuca virosa]|uniref:Uncharacterized protein n=1 Tax=Lactuca virosa TaxID=75947 RepID=A0AAU9LZR1_9ASTR|nr:unnamed protein product [Lactuca virosa]
MIHNCKLFKAFSYDKKFCRQKLPFLFLFVAFPFSQTATLSDSDPTFFLHNHNHLLNLDLRTDLISLKNLKETRVEVSLLCTWYIKISPN